MEQVYVARRVRARRRRRRRVLAMWFFSLCTIAALLAVAWVAVRLDRLHGTQVTAVPAAETRARVAPPVLTDSSARLSYDQLGPPWRSGCPAPLTTSVFSWTGGEAAVAGQGYDAALGRSVTWYGSACSGPLPGQFSGSGLKYAAAAALRAITAAYYAGRPHSLHVVASQPVRVGASPAWRILFRVHVAWSDERGAVVVAGGGLYYVSVPDDLGTWTYWALVGSLR